MPYRYAVHISVDILILKLLLERNQECSMHPTTNLNSVYKKNLVTPTYPMPATQASSTLSSGDFIELEVKSTAVHALQNSQTVAPEDPYSANITFISLTHSLTHSLTPWSPREVFRLKVSS